ncbi:MAG TPA: Mur ligase family protein [Gemmatimonadaceae bacterium]|nr:Mur ligase family protein [Gemmatimonadaceae bacterium]
MKLSALARALHAPLHGADADARGIAVDSRRVAPGDLFVALPGTRSDGTAYVGDAVARGAVGVCASRPWAGVPTIEVAEPRQALARLAAAFYGQPARSLRLIGITGTLGKTSTALLVQSALAGNGRVVGVVGSLGARIAGLAGAPPALPDHCGMTTPDAHVLHHTFRAMADARVGTVVMEVTSHALAQRRVEGLTFAAGVFTNLVPDEHLEFHSTPGHYLRTKARFLDLLEGGAPIVVNHDDPLVRELVRERLGSGRRSGPRHAVIGVSAAGAADAAAVVEDLRVDTLGSSFVLRLRAPLPRLDDDPLAPLDVPLRLPLLGVQQAANAALAATAALVAGAPPDEVSRAVAAMQPMHRRMEVVRAADPLVLDDTVGNPQSLRAVFDTVRLIPHAGVRVIFGIRGMRGPEINRRLAHTLAGLVVDRGTQVPTRLVVTACEDAAGPRDRVLPEEQAVVRDVLDAARAPYEFEPTLAGAVARLLDGAAPGELVLLLGAQGMDAAAELTRARLDGG